MSMSNMSQIVTIDNLIKNGSLSPSNYKKPTILNQDQHEVQDYLNAENLYQKGVEPGSSAYAPFSSLAFLRNSCINDFQYTVDKDKYIYLNPAYCDNASLSDNDVLFCTDANIGDCCLYISNNENVALSSGIVKLNFTDNKYKYYVLAFMKDEYFKEQLLSKTPKGSTIKHAGDMFLQCKIPDAPDSWVYDVYESLVKNIAYAEVISGQKLHKSSEILTREIITQNYSYACPDIKELLKSERLDAGIYSDAVFQWQQNVRHYKNGYTNLNGYGFDTKRGPSLQVRDLGRSIQTAQYRKGYDLLIYPSDISSAGYINRVTYLGAKNPVWFLKNKYILFSSEGTIGKTFIICDEDMHFTTNIHGTMIYPVDPSTDIKYSIFLGLYLNWLRSNHVLARMSVGANGGSFAVGYWDNILIPRVDESVLDQLADLYNNSSNLQPTAFDINTLQQAGVYQINTFLINCKALLSTLCNDIKNKQLKDQDYYKKLFW